MRCLRRRRSPTCWSARAFPFREAHGIVGELVRDALASERSLSELTREDLARHSEHLDDYYYELLRRDSWLESKRVEGGTSSASLERQFGFARETLEAVRARVVDERS